MQPLKRSRREALKLLGFTSIATLAAACSPAPGSPAAPIAAPSAAPTQPPTSAPAAAAPPVATSAPAQAAATTTAPAGAASPADWDKLVAAARQEGSVSVASYAGTSYRKVMDAFQAAYPGVSVDLTQFQSSSRDFLPRLLAERKANLYTFDVSIMPPQEMLRQARPQGALDPVRPEIVHPNVLADTAWRDSFEGGFLDTEKRWGYATVSMVSQDVWVDGAQVQNGEISSLKDLLDPKWKGKIIGGDPRTKGSGFQPLTAMRVQTKDDSIVKRLYVDQEIVRDDDYRRATEAMVRGKYPVGIGAIDPIILKDFTDQGLGKTLKPVSVPEAEYVYSRVAVAWVHNQRPHPNAARLFLNWFLSKDGGQAWAKEIGENSRRADVAPANEAIIPKPGVTYVRIQAEELLDETEKTQKLAKDSLG